MNCKPGDLARVIESAETRRCGTTDKILKLTEIIGLTHGGLPAWGYEGPRIFYLGTELIGFADSVLRPIRDPGDDARDETLDWLPVPSKEREHA